MNLTEIQLFVFDMAGTTVNEDNVVYKTLAKSICKFGTNVNLKTVLTYGAGKEKHQAIKDILSFKEVDTKGSQQIFDYFNNELDKAYESLNVKPIDGVEEILLRIKDENKNLVLNTGYNLKIANCLLEKLNWKKGIHYDALITADDVENGRPAPDMIQKAMNICSIIDSSKVLKAGDSTIDIEEGKNASCGITVGVLSGAQTKEQLSKANPTFILNSLAELRI